MCLSTQYYHFHTSPPRAQLLYPYLNPGTGLRRRSSSIMRPSPLLAVLLLASEVKDQLHSEVGDETKVQDVREQRRQRWTRYSSSVAMDRISRGRRQDVPADGAVLSNGMGSIANGTVVGPLDLPVGENEPHAADVPQGPQEVNLPAALVVDLPAVPAVVLSAVPGVDLPAAPEVKISAIIDAGTAGNLPAEEQNAKQPLVEQPEEVLPEEELPEVDIPEVELPEEELPEVGDDGPDGGLIGDLNDGILSPEGQNIADILLGNGKTNEENFEIGIRPGFDDHTGCDGKDPCCRWYYISKDLTSVFHNADGTCNSLARQSIRMGFHDAETWSAKLAASGKNNGGADGSLVLFGELSRPVREL